MIPSSCHAIRPEPVRCYPFGPVLVIVSFLGCLGSSAWAQVDPVSVRTPLRQAWVGQCVPFFVDLRANGSFEGTASFDLPQIPGAVIIKVGNPVVSSEEIEDESWFVQSHEFALYSQRAGQLKVPGYTVRFANREGFVGEARERRVPVPGWRVEIQRPPESEDVGFLITTDTFDVQESWDPAPGSTMQVGDILKRTIAQRASQLSGMALAPAPIRVPDGVKVYSSQVETRDDLERGEFLGSRTEEITYLLTKPGSLTLPAITYVWWNPKANELQSRTIPEVPLNVAPVRTELDEAVSSGSDSRFALGMGVSLFAMTLGIGVWQWHRLLTWIRRSWARFNPPHRLAAKALVRACRAHDAVGAEKAWLVWRSTQGDDFCPGIELQSAIRDLDRQLFGRQAGAEWNGDSLLHAFRTQRGSSRQRDKREKAMVLPRLNP